MEVISLEGWVRREAYNKGFSKDDLFIGEIRLHNVLINQIPATMIAQGHNQQTVRKELLRLIDHRDFVEELEKESRRRRKRRARNGSLVLDTPPPVTEPNPILEEWIRDESHRAAFSKEDMFIGEIRLHNVLINSITATMSSQGYTPQAVRKALLKMIDEGFSKELQKESRQRRGISESNPEPSTDGGSVSGSQSGVAMYELKDAEFPPLGKQNSDTVSPWSIMQTPPPPQQTHSTPPVDTEPTPPPSKWVRGTQYSTNYGEMFASFRENREAERANKPKEPPVIETIGAKRLKALKFPFCVQHTILTNIQTSLEVACFNYSHAHCPSLLSRKGWGCSHAGELNKWAQELRRSYDLGELSGAIISDPTRLENILKELDDLRDIAVHRTPTSEQRVVELVGFALDAMVILEDKEGEKRVRDIAEAINGCTQECIDSLDKLNLELDEELRHLDIERKKLEEKELKIREKSESAMKEVENSVEYRFINCLKALDLHSHYVGSK